MIHGQLSRVDSTMAIMTFAALHHCLPPSTFSQLASPIPLNPDMTLKGIVRIDYIII